MKVFSGIQPTGSLHLGNYLGAIKQWIELQEEHDCLFCIVDLHALTSDYNPEELPESIVNKVAAYLAAGVNPQQSTIFVQSQVKEHAELAWLLSTVTPVGELERMTQYKKKSKKQKSVNAGLLNYPVLMAADILLYKSELVPVGEDQQQHLELTRTIARKFNNKFGNTFPEPEAKTTEQGARIMSLQEPTNKMSKSDGEESYVSLFDSPEEIKEKIMSAQTDSGREIKYDEKEKPGISNLINIYSLFSDKEVSQVEQEFNGGYQEFKKALAELVIQELEPFRQKKDELSKNQINEILEEGRKEAEQRAQDTMKEIKEKMGLPY
ncbi:MAG: tryptophan--tRNA ligase [Candidatus Paceibacterota bacterium]